jgi:acyl carrier protein
MPIAAPVRGVAVHLLDKWLQSVAPTGVGELYVGGDVATAFLGDPVGTAERFVPSPFVAGRRLVKTGLLGVRLGDGRVAMLGRRGARISAGEKRCDAARIELLLLQHPGVMDAQVLPLTAELTARIAAFVTVADTAVSEGALWARLAARLTRAAMPDLISVVARLPVDDQPADLSAAEAAATHQSASGASAVESAMGRLWCELLDLGRDIAPTEDFFDLGGDSLLATKLAFHVEETLGAELTIADVFALRTLGRIAARVAQSSDAASGAPPRLESVDRRGPLPVASAQNRLLFLQRLNPATSAYNCGAGIELKGRLSLPLVLQSFGEVVRRQEALRTAFHEVDGAFRQVVLPARPVMASFVDLCGVVPECQPEVGQMIRRAGFRRPFQLDTPPPFRLTIADRGEGAWELSLTVHHLVSDAWSQGVLVREFSRVARRYHNGAPSDLDPLRCQYGDYAVWQARRLDGAYLTRLTDAWLTLAGRVAFEPVRIPGGPRQVAADRVAFQRFTVAAALRGRLEAACRGRGATLYMLLLAAFQDLLHRVSGQDRLTVVATSANRYPREMADVIGFFAHTFPVPSERHDGDSVLTGLDRTRDYLIEALRLQELPFDKIVETLRRRRPGLDPAKLNVSFVMTPPLDTELSVPGATVRPVTVDDLDPRFDVELQLRAEHGGIVGTVVYATRFLSAADAGALVAQYVSTLESAVKPAAPAPGAVRPVAGLRRPVPVAARPVSR